MPENETQKYKYYKSRFSNHIEGRVSRLEGAVESLTFEVQEITKAVRDVTGSMSNFREDVLSSLGKLTAPKWPLISAFVAVGTTMVLLASSLIAVILSGQSSTIQQLNNKVENLQNYTQSVEFERGINTSWKTQIEKDINQLISLNDGCKLWRRTHEVSDTMTHGQLQGQIDVLDTHKLLHDRTDIYGKTILPGPVLE